jgi:hypothetical protein
MSETFDRGETVGLDGTTVTFLASEGRWAWLQYPSGDCATSRISDLRKLPPPFAVVNETCTCGAMLCVGEAQIYYAECAQANRVAEKINAAFVARMAEEKAGAK